jgi:ribosomal protein S19
MRSQIKDYIAIDFLRREGGYKTFFKPVYRGLASKKSEVYVWSRRSVVTPPFIGKRVAVYNGRKFFSFLVRPSMLGFKFGEFSVTKKINAIHTIYKRSSRLKRHRSKAPKTLVKGGANISRAMKNKARAKKLRKTLARNKGRRNRLRLQ